MTEEVSLYNQKIRVVSQAVSRRLLLQKLVFDTRAI